MEATYQRSFSDSSQTETSPSFQQPASARYRGWLILPLCLLSEILGEAAMVNETELFYLVMLILLTLIILLVLSATGPRQDGKSRR
jgi:hypothetical protein